MADWTDAQVTQFIVTMAWAMGGLTVAVVSWLCWPLARPWLHDRRAALLPLGLIIGSTLAGGFAGEPLIGLLAGIIGAAFVIFGPLLVNHSQEPAPDYVTHDDDENARSPAFALEREREREREPAPNGVKAPVQLNGTLYTPEQLDRIKRRVRDDGAAEVIGLALATGMFPVGQRTAVMEAIYGKRGERWQKAQPAIDDAMERFAPPEPARVTPVAERATGATFAPQLQRAPAPPAEEPAA